MHVRFTFGTQHYVEVGYVHAFYKVANLCCYISQVICISIVKDREIHIIRTQEVNNGHYLFKRPFSSMFAINYESQKVSYTGLRVGNILKNCIMRLSHSRRDRRIMIYKCVFDS
eukprot:NODE_715_length_4836_cov_0.118640.p5 type:complete len:114 gc:universal NODE_715_length_4836_cov_0.118640:3949-3608(-)